MLGRSNAMDSLEALRQQVTASASYVHENQDLTQQSIMTVVSANGTPQGKTTSWKAREPKSSSKGIKKRRAARGKVIVAWRKYGEKWIQCDSQHPPGTRLQRLYYRCNSSSCQAKKQVEHMLIPGEPKSSKVTITGEHNHATLDLVSGKCQVEGSTRQEVNEDVESPPEGSDTSEEQSDEKDDEEKDMSRGQEDERPTRVNSVKGQTDDHDLDRDAMLLVGVGAFAN